ncbi:ABC transporter permease [Kineosporia sp. NBRC 101731]|uniref:ABC transporter permease n=1 Tax=Kineosporia sp. NBRC 101731 TaxID=3032199 RepID=UPI0024A2511A|nr:ABC transporter permease [Kineosporia sp. NBRC 101731]GLY30275.1 transport permease protein [Kineosporia sp. NBRC 101731]
MSALADEESATGWAHRLAAELGQFRGAGSVVARNGLAARRGLPVLLSGFFEPLFYLLSLGTGIGVLVGGVEYGGKSFSYQEFIAPALLAASAMNGAVADSTFNVFWKLKYARVYDGMLATPLGPRAVAAGEICWALLRGAGYATAFLLILLMAGYVRSWWAVLAVPAATLVGLAFAGAGMAATTFMRSWQDFDLVHLVVLPLLLLSTTFYPLSTYPQPFGVLVQLTPLYHGVELERALVLGTMDASVAVHVLYLLVLGTAGLFLAGRRLERLLLS